MDNGTHACLHHSARSGEQRGHVAYFRNPLEQTFAKYGTRCRLDRAIRPRRHADGWWAPITSADKQIDSPFNTYTHAGLPPHPISNPGIAAISAALNPATTTCLYYLHDSNRVIHCADTLDQQENNIVKYLK